MKKKGVVIVGASSGIGAEMAKEYAKRGNNLVIAARRIDRLESLKQEILSQFPSTRVTVQACDVTQPQEVEELMKVARNDLGQIDVVIANAGFGKMGVVENLKLQDFRDQFETNVFGVVQTVQAALGDLKKSKGQVVIVGSGMSYISLPGTSAYSMSKFAVKAFADSLRYEVRKDGVDVTLICPGTTASEFTQVSLGRELEQADSSVRFLKMSSRKAAQLAVRGAEQHRSEVHLTLHSKLGVWMQRHFPFVMRSAMNFSTERLIKVMT